MLKENTQKYCHMYTIVGSNDLANDRYGRYQKVTLTLEVCDVVEYTNGKNMIALPSLHSVDNLMGIDAEAL